MKHTGKPFLYFWLLLFPYICLQAQPAFVSPNLTVDPSITFKAEIKVGSFNRIIGTQFSVNWDASVLEYKGVTDLNQAMELELLDNFGFVDTVPNKLGFQWYDESLDGINLSDSTVLFSIEFEAIGNPASSSILTFTDDPTMREVADTSFDAIPALFHDGSITIMGPNATNSEQTINSLLKMEAAFPNPFYEETKISITLARPLNAQVCIYNTQGQLIHKQEKNFSSGTQSLTLDRSLFTGAGVYYFNLKAYDSVLTQRLILVR